MDSYLYEPMQTYLLNKYLSSLQMVKIARVSS